MPRAVEDETGRRYRRFEIKFASASSAAGTHAIDVAEQN